MRRADRFSQIGLVGQLKVNSLPLGLTVSFNGCEGKGRRGVCNQWLRRIHASSAVTCVERYCPVGVGEEEEEMEEGGE